MSYLIFIIPENLCYKLLQSVQVENAGQPLKKETVDKKSCLKKLAT